MATVVQAGLATVNTVTCRHRQVLPKESLLPAVSI